MYYGAERCKQIVFIEDNADCRESISVALGIEGYSIALASEHAEAIELLNRTTPDIIFIDFHGVTDDMKQFVEDIKSLHPRVPLVLTTGAPDPDVKSRTLGMSEYLVKPFEIGELTRVLQRHQIWPLKVDPLEPRYCYSF
jgi:DNA-binding NtrC family response regulator